MLDSRFGLPVFTVSKNSFNSCFWKSLRSSSFTFILVLLSTYIVPLSAHYPSCATPFLPFSAADPTDLTFSHIKKKFGGGKSKNCKSQGWRVGSVFGWQTAGLVSQIVLFFPLHICSYLLVFAKMGSSVSQDTLQIVAQQALLGVCFYVLMPYLR